MKLRTLFILFIFQFSLINYGYAQEEEFNYLVNTYYSAIQKHNYKKAFSLLSKRAKDYYKTVENFASTFSVPQIDIIKFKPFKTVITGNNGKVKLLLIYNYLDFYSGKVKEITKTVEVPLIKENKQWYLELQPSPWRSLLVNKKVVSHNLKVEVYAIDFYLDTLKVMIILTNLGKDPIEIFPYNEKTILQEKTSNTTLHLVKLPYDVDRKLYLGKTLEGGQVVKGFLNFLGSFSSKAKEINLIIGGNLNPKSPPPFEIVIKGIKL